MTKKEWYKINIGTRVWDETHTLKNVDGKIISKKIYRTGVIKRINSNGSQALVDWGGNDNWHGRLSIELIDSLPKIDMP